MKPKVRCKANFRSEFKVLTGNGDAQAAEMTLKPGATEGGPNNSHRGSDQWMYVVAGNGKAIINKQSISLKTGVLVFIGRGKTHEIRNTGSRALKTLNFYVPPAYDKNGEPLQRGKPTREK